MDEQVPDWAQEAAQNLTTPDWAQGDDTDFAPAPKTPETDKSLWHQMQTFAKAHEIKDPAWLTSFLKTPAPKIPESVVQAAPSIVKPIAGFWNQAANMVTPENAMLIGATETASALQPELAPWLNAAVFSTFAAPAAARLPGHARKLASGTATSEEGSQAAQDVLMTVFPFLHAGAAKAADVAFPEAHPPLAPGGVGTWTRPSTLKELTPPGFIRKYGEAPEDLGDASDIAPYRTEAEEQTLKEGTPDYARFQGEIAAAHEAEKKTAPLTDETDEAAEARFNERRKKLEQLGGEWEPIYQDMTEQRDGTPPTYSELADELEDEIRDRSYTPEVAIQNYEIGLAKRRTQKAQAMEDALAQEEGRPPNKVKPITVQEIRDDYSRRVAQGYEDRMQQVRDAALSRKELLEEQQARKRGGKYASKVTSPTRLSEPEIRTLLGKKTRVRQQRPSAQPRSPGAQPGPASERPVVTETAPPETAPPQSVEPSMAPASGGASPQSAKAPGGFEGDNLYPTDQLSVRGTETVTPEQVTGIKKKTNSEGKTVYAITYKVGDEEYIGYSDNPEWENDPNFGKGFGQKQSAKAPGGAEPSGPLWEKAQRTVNHKFGLPNEPRALMRRRTQFRREEDPTDEELQKAYQMEYDRLKREEAAKPEPTPSGQPVGSQPATSEPESVPGKWRLIYKKGESTPASEPEPAPTEPQVEPGAPKPYKPKRASRDQFANSPETPVSTAVSEMGGILSKSSAKRAGKLEGNEALWDDLPKLADPSHKKIWQESGEMPDIMAQTLHDAGLIHEPTVDAMYREIERESHTVNQVRKAEKATTKQTHVPVKQAENFGKGQREEAEAGAQAIPASKLNVGDIVTVDGTPLEVVDVSPDDGTVTLENGKKYGKQEISDGDVVYGEHEPDRPVEEEPEFVEPEPPADSPTKLRGKAFTKSETQARTYVHKLTGLIVRGRVKSDGKWVWEAIHPETNEVLNTETSRRRALDANLSGTLEKQEPPEEIKNTETAKAADTAEGEEHDFSTMEGFANAIKERYGREITAEEKKVLEPMVREVNKLKKGAEAARKESVKEILNLFKDTEDISWEDAVKQVHEAITDAVKKCGG